MTHFSDPKCKKKDYQFLFFLKLITSRSRDLDILIVVHGIWNLDFERTLDVLLWRYMLGRPKSGW